MSYQPGPNDTQCTRCREWYHRALKACPMCDAPRSAVRTKVDPTTQGRVVIAGLIAGALITVGTLFAILGQDTSAQERDAHEVTARWFTSESTYVLPYNPELKIFVIVVPATTSGQVARELALSARQMLKRSGSNAMARVQTPAGQILATTGWLD